ncbi:unnamed protein product, partial [Choristocarpus tenellus]
CNTCSQKAFLSRGQRICSKESQSFCAVLHTCFMTSKGKVTGSSVGEARRKARFHFQNQGVQVEGTLNIPRGKFGSSFFLHPFTPRQGLNASCISLNISIARAKV